jgi:hypothetical protein
MLPYMWAVLWWMSAPSLLFVLLVHMCGVTHCLLCASANTARMGDVLVNKDEWVKLARELGGIRDDTGKVESFMLQHVNTKWVV